jgi:hypothetical protein
MVSKVRATSHYYEIRIKHLSLLERKGIVAIEEWA